MNGPLKTHGGKHYLAKRIVAMMPKHTTYLEPFFGGGSVLLAKNPEGVSEVVSDVNRDLTRFWEVLASEQKFEMFLRIVQALPFSEAVWCNASGGEVDTLLEYPLEIRCAVRFFVVCRQSLAGRGVSFAPLSTNRTRRGMNEQAAGWLSTVEGLPKVHARMKRVVVLTQDFRKLIPKYDRPGVLMYCDPPYLHSTRTHTTTYNEHELSVQDHQDLLTVLTGLKKAKVLLSGYPSRLYDEALTGWTCQTFPVANHAASGKAKRKMSECVWSNYTMRL